jgi:choline monooxygenase
VCTHRANLVAEAPGQAQALRCRYHGRRFALDGCYLSMPEFEAAEDFPAETDDLTPVAFDTWEPLVFAALDPALPFDTWLGPVRERLAWMRLESFEFDASRSRDYELNANWALYCDNALEGFHIPFVHSGLASKLDYGSYRTELFEFANVQVGVVSETNEVFDLREESPDYGRVNPRSPAQSSRSSFGQRAAGSPPTPRAGPIVCQPR